MGVVVKYRTDLSNEINHRQKNIMHACTLWPHYGQCMLLYKENILLN